MSGRRIAMMAAGAVGGYFGGRLAAAGRDVTFIARGAHYDAIRERGLRIDSDHAPLLVKPAKVEREPAAVGPVDAVLFAVKLADTERAAQALAPMLGPQTAVFPFQNGVESAERIGAVIGAERVVPGGAYVAAALSAPGVVRQVGTMARMVFGEPDGRRSARCEALLADCQAAGIEAEISDDVTLALWSKFVRLAPLAAVTALTRHPIGPVRDNAETAALLKAAVAEAVAVGRAQGVALPPDAEQAVMAWIGGLPADMTSSMAHDLGAGKPLELPWLSGAVVRLGEAAGVATPTHRFVVQALALHAPGRRSARAAAA